MLKTGMNTNDVVKETLVPTQISMKRSVISSGSIMLPVESLRTVCAFKMARSINDTHPSPGRTESSVTPTCDSA